MSEHNLTHCFILFSFIVNYSFLKCIYCYKLQKYKKICEAKNEKKKILHNPASSCADQPTLHILHLLHRLRADTESHGTQSGQRHAIALEKAYADIGLTIPTAQTSWERDPKLKAFLKSLG
jgi:hypothetical protein